MMRLATAHCMNLMDLASFIPCRVSVHRLIGCDFHGVGERAVRFIHAVEAATGKTLETASMGRFRNLIGPQQLTTKRTPRYCPLCVREAKEELPYGRLTWELSFVDACRIHRTRLVSARTCGASDTEWLRVGRRPVHPGVCGKCGSIGFRCCGTLAEASEKEIWVAAESGEIVALPKQTVAGFTSEGLRAGIEATVRKAFKGEPVTAALQSGLARACVLTWLQGKSRPALGSLFKFAYSANASVRGIFEGEFRESGTPGAVVKERLAPRRYIRHDWRLIRAALIEAGRRENSPTVEAIARELHVDRKELRKRLPMESEVLIQKAAQRRRLGLVKYQLAHR